MALTVLFDDRCGKCRRFVRLSSALDFAGRLDVVGLSDPRITREFSHFDLETLNFEMHVIDLRGRVFRGFYAIRRIAREVPLMWPLADPSNVTRLCRSLLHVIRQTRPRLDGADGVDAGPDVEGIKPPDGAGVVVPSREISLDIRAQS